MKKLKAEQEDFNPFEAILAECRHIILYGEIDNESAREINSKLYSMAYKHPKLPIHLEINSPGGSVSDGIAIMNAIQLIPSPVMTMINGEACSMAGIISVVGDYRVIAPNSYWLGHPMRDLVEGTPKTIKDRGIYLEKLEENLREVFKKKTKLSDKEFDAMLRGELWLNAEECLEKGIVDEVQKLPERRPINKKKCKHCKK